MVRWIWCRGQWGALDSGMSLALHLGPHHPSSFAVSSEVPFATEGLCEDQLDAGSVGQMDLVCWFGFSGRRRRGMRCGKHGSRAEGCGRIPPLTPLASFVDRPRPSPISARSGGGDIGPPARRGQIPLWRTPQGAGRVGPRPGPGPGRSTNRGGVRGRIRPHLRPVLPVPHPPPPSTAGRSR